MQPTYTVTAEDGGNLVGNDASITIAEAFFFASDQYRKAAAALRAVDPAAAEQMTALQSYYQALGGNMSTFGGVDITRSRMPGVDAVMQGYIARVARAINARGDGGFAGDVARLRHCNAVVALLDGRALPAETEAAAGSDNV